MQNQITHPSDSDYEKAVITQESNVHGGIPAIYRQGAPEYEMSPVERLQKLKESGKLSPRAMEKVDNFILLENCDSQRGIPAFYKNEDPEYDMQPLERFQKLKESGKLSSKAMEKVDDLIVLENLKDHQAEMQVSCHIQPEASLMVVKQPKLVVPTHVETKDDINAYNVAEEIRTCFGFVYVSTLIFAFWMFCHQLANGKMLKTIVIDFLKTRYGMVRNGYLVKDIQFFLEIPPNISTVIPRMHTQCIPFHNGILDVITGKMHPPDPKRFLLHLVQANYRPDLLGKCPVMMNFVNYIAGGSSMLIKRIWQSLAFIVSNVYAKYFVVFVGVGDSGKSLMIKLIESFFYPSSCFAMTYQKLAARFSASSLNGKKLCICPDLPKKAISNEAAAVIKMITGGDTMTAEAKYKDQDTMMIDGLRLVCGSNFPLMLKDPDPAMDKRTLNIVFPYAVPKDAQDPNLLEHLISEKEAIIATALSFLPELISNNFQFEGEFETQAILDDLYGNVVGVAVSDQIASFIDNHIAFEEGVYTPTENLFNAFNTYAPGVVGDSAAFSKLFRDGLVAIGRSDIVGGRLTIAGKKQRGYSGLKLV